MKPWYHLEADKLIASWLSEPNLILELTNSKINWVNHVIFVWNEPTWSQAEAETWLLRAHGPAKGGGRGASAPASSTAGFWLSNGATSSSESNCNYVYIVADDDDGDDDVRRFIPVVAVALTTEEERRLNVLIMNSWNGSWIIKVDQSFVLILVRGPHAHACLEIIKKSKKQEELKLPLIGALNGTLPSCNL